MVSSTTARDRSRIAVAAVSGLTTITALSATGWVAGSAARATEADRASPTTPATQTPTNRHADRRVRADARTDDKPEVILRQRPQRTHVSVRYVQGTPSAPVGSGGTVSQPVTHTPAAPAPAPQPAAPAPAPAPAPPPAPSSGS
ncbi:MAG TPA: hypothetical protein VFT70_00885 [Nocardioides sp.]|nr:hypothetical protein [Nocardioides sp.]